jgi:hypothetical protein
MLGCWVMRTLGLSGGRGVPVVSSGHCVRGQNRLHAMAFVCDAAADWEVHGWPGAESEASAGVNSARPARGK